MPRQPKGGYPSKGYRISKFHIQLFDACSNVYGTSKSALAYALLFLKEPINPRVVKNLPELHSYQLLECMLQQLWDQEESYPRLTHHLFSQRMKELKGMKEPSFWEGKRLSRHFRLSMDSREAINEYTKKYNLQVGNTLELAICIFVNEREDDEYILIKTVFESLLHPTEDEDETQ
ncbi:hypothetical protein [Ammoniphilus sp. 3BR4]|uniref:hypothetical protein n=1 Tax=Ammoniphilus sp. 3BR4 TaxID=3158265 RepID=UPI0034658FBF